ncbi:tetratricopeptide repeat protein [Frankia nepalensis]|uniref:tetratricopeptide repeat protein n=1 Tax=Frankia nepalensis TaxID=1836974 RepID=UPI0027DE4078|nr:tetratricopeptide repeat protein [Frankia nepalensis]
MLAATAAAALVLGVGTGTGGGQPAGSAAAAQPPPTPATRIGQQIDGLTARLRQVPGDWPGWAALGGAYVEQARITGDPTAYPRAEIALARSLEIHPDGNDLALAGQAALAAARHDFPAALRLADAAIAVNEYSAPAHGVRADALVELGRYPEAWLAVQRMVDLRPDVSSLARASYAFELRGEVEPAREALNRVLADASSPADVAFAWLHLGELARDTGDLTGAEEAFRRGLVADPTSPALLAGRARVAAAQGLVDAALADYRTATGRSPQPALVIEYGELLAAVGRQPEADQQYALARSAAGLLRAQGVDVDVELALFEADHGDPEAALAAVTDARQRRGGVFVDDAQAWALHRLGRDAEALEYARAAVALGTPRALFRYHLGVIEAALGQSDAAVANLRAALALDPAFSPLHAPLARNLLGSLDAVRPVGGAR